MVIVPEQETAEAALNLTRALNLLEFMSAMSKLLKSVLYIYIFYQGASHGANEQSLLLYAILTK